MVEKQKIDLRPLGDLTILNVMNAEDFSLNMVFNGQVALKMNYEQWEGFVKEIMALWSQRK